MGQPNGYILGEEAGGAFIGGLRYGDGTLYAIVRAGLVKHGRTWRVFWVRSSDFLRPSDFGRAILDNGNSFEYRKRVSAGFAALGRAAVCTSCTCSIECRR